jgi:predicted metal-dependent hydrolase
MRVVMEVRRIEVDFSQAKIHWLPTDPELAQFWNALGYALPVLESFLVRTMRQARDLLPAAAVDAREDCEKFCAQETNHFLTHRKYNEMLERTGYYPELPRYLDEIRADYQEFAKKRGVRFCLLYTEGFETAGPTLAGWFLKQSDRRRKEPGTDLVTLALWRWHLSEEFEHRCVAFNAVNKLYPGYFSRVYGVIYAALHLVGFGLRVSRYMLREDIKAGRVEGGWIGFRRKFLAYGALFSYLIPRTLRALTPWYDPVNLPIPEGSAEVLATASETLSLNIMAARTPTS